MRKRFCQKNKTFIERFREDLFVECTQKKFILKEHVKTK